MVFFEVERGLGNRGYIFTLLAVRMDQLLLAVICCGR
jgi:hypothetical protein